MKKTLCLIFMMAALVSTSQVTAQQYYEGEYVFSLNDQLVRQVNTWQTSLPSKYQPIYIKVIAYKVVSGKLVEVPWYADANPFHEINKTKVDKHTLKLSLNHNKGGNWGCSVNISIDENNDLIGLQFWVNLPPDSY